MIEAPAARPASDPFLHRSEAKVVEDLVASASEEVTGELRASQTHSEVTDREHEDLDLLATTLSSQTKSFEFGSTTVEVQSSIEGVPQPQL